MKYFKYWVKESFNISIEGSNENITILSGSNISKENASEEAKNRADTIEKRIQKNDHVEDYKTPIKEYVEEIIDESNIVTVCRYGAKILNTNQYTILDLDDFPINFLDLFRPIRKLKKKDRIVAKFLERIEKSPELGTDFRIYETTKGIRVIGKNYIDPSSSGYSSLMRKVMVDWIYIQLTKKQNCYRARLTPKPYRLKMKTIKVKDPLVVETQEYVAWSKEYKKNSENYSVVHLLKTVGRDFSRDPIIRFHDDACNANYNGKLA